jgi:hypothetical protein
VPLYAYEDPKTGLKADLRRPVADRNKPVILRRARSIPDRVGVLIPGATEEGSFNRTIIKAYHRKEEREGSRFRSEHSKKKIKSAWEN